VTSTDGWVRRLGRGWNELHRLVYPIAAVTFLHIVLVRYDTMTFAYLVWLLGYRVMRRAHLSTGIIGLAALAVVVFAASLAAEFTFVATRTLLDPWRVIAAEFDPAFMIVRPVWKVLALGLAVAAIYGIRRIPLPAWLTRPVAAGLQRLPKWRRASG
jgi:sulfoxide reductase heme-binding subunit YedZ